MCGVLLIVLDRMVGRRALALQGSLGPGPRPGMKGGGRTGEKVVLCMALVLCTQYGVWTMYPLALALALQGSLSCVRVLSTTRGQGRCQPEKRPGTEQGSPLSQTVRGATILRTACMACCD